MNTHTRIFRALSLPNRRRGLGLGLAALTGLSMPACDAPEDGEFAELTEEDSDGSESEAIPQLDDAELVVEQTPVALTTVDIDADTYGTDLELTMSGSNVLVLDGSTGAQLASINVSGVDKIVYNGTGGDDRLFAYTVTVDMEVWAKGGDDDIRTGSGSDKIYGANGADILHGSTGNDYVNGGNGDDTLYGGYGADVLEGGKGEDDVYGQFGNDILFANQIHNTGNDTWDDALYGGDGTDFMWLGSGDSSTDVENDRSNAIMALPHLWCTVFGDELVRMKSRSSDEFVSADNETTNLVGVYLKTEPSMGTSEKFYAHCDMSDTYPYKLFYQRSGYGFGDIWAASWGPWWGNDEIDGGIYAGPNGNLDVSADHTFEHHRDILEGIYLSDSLEDAMDGYTGSGHLPFYDGATASWTFGSDDETGIWKIGNPYITYDADGVVTDENLFQVTRQNTW